MNRSFKVLLSLTAMGLLLLLLADNASAGFFGLGKKKEAEQQAATQNEPTSEVINENAKDKGAAVKSVGQTNRQTKRPDLDAIRNAAKDHERINKVEPPARDNMPKRPSFFSDDVQGHSRRRPGQQPEGPQADDNDDYDDDDDEDDDDDQKQLAGGKGRRADDKSMRAELAAKYVSTSKNADGKTAAEKARELIKFNKASAKRPRVTTQAHTNNFLSSRNADSMVGKSKFTSGSYWQKKIDQAYKVTKKGIKESAKAMADIPKYVEQATDSINAFMQLDGKGKILALINEVEGDMRFVRREFSQFTLIWSPIMERGLDFLGSENLDKIRWNENDDLDQRRDALHSLAFGYEFMRLMIIWRENLLTAHEAFKTWLVSTKHEIENKKIEIDENVIIQLRTTHSYLLLTSWMTMGEAMNEARTKLDHLMEVEDDRPKKYEFEFFRNILVLQEMYDPTREEFDRERDQVVDAIRDSGVVVENLTDVDAFFEDFRNKLAAHEIDYIDWEVPQELTDFMNKLEPQLRRSTLVYSKSFLNELGLRR